MLGPAQDRQEGSTVCGACKVAGLETRLVLIFSSCIRNLVPIKVPQGVSELCEISKV